MFTLKKRKISLRERRGTATKLSPILCLACATATTTLAPAWLHAQQPTGNPDTSTSQQDSPQNAPDAPGVSVTDAGNRVIYSQEYFERYNVINARDQLERIPGIQGLINGGGGGRGFGNSGDQVLINGKRLSGKSNNIGSTLGRIQARQVTRIEVIRGTVDDLDVRSQGRVVNVVLEDTLSTGYGSWEGSMTHYSDGRSIAGGELNYAGDFGALNYLMSLEYDPSLNRGEQTDLFYNPTGELVERQDEFDPRESDEYTLTTNTSYSFSNGDVLNLNGLYSDEDEVREQYSDRFLVSGATETYVREVLIDNDDVSSNWEVGGDYSHTQDNGNILTTLFVVTSSTSDESSGFTVTPAGSEGTLLEVQQEQQTNSEKILRGTYQWGISETRSFESGAELAINTVERDIQLFEEENGMLQETALFNQGSTVEENRLEAFTTFTWQVLPDLLVESSLDVEFSELTQEGRDVSRSRDFFFVRPRLVTRYDLTPSSQIRGSIVRTVNQLNFGAFTSSFTNDDNRRDVISAGNPELVPQKAWEYELTYERRLPDDLGLVSVTGSYNDIEDRSSRIPLLIENEDGSFTERTAPGNIGDGHFMQLELNASVRLGWLNLDRAIVEGSLEFSDSEVTDPFTGQKRHFNWMSPWQWSLSFRHDTNWKNFSYGISTWQQAENQQFDLDYQQRGRQDPDLEIFAEMQPVNNLTLRLEIEDILRSESERERLQFVGNRGDGILERRELRFSRPVREITFSLQGVF